MNRILLSLIVSLFICSIGFSQAILSIGSVNGIPGNTISIPVQASSIIDMTGFQFTITYDKTKMTYVDCSNWGGGVTVSDVQITPLDGKITFVFNNINSAININSGKFFDLNFTVNNGQTGISAISWSDDPTVKELSNSKPEVINCKYTNGDVNISTVSEDHPPYVKVPIKDISVLKNEPNQIFYLSSVFADDDLNDQLNYFISSNSNTLVVDAKIVDSILTLNFSTTNIGLSEISVKAVSNGKEVLSTFNVEVKLSTGTEPIIGALDYKVYPNPTIGKVKIVMNNSNYFGTNITVYDLLGKSITKQLIQCKEEWIDLSGYTPGVYLIKSEFKEFNPVRIVLK